MSKADEMFEELGYEKDLHINKKEQVWGEYFYNQRLDTLISFDYIDKGLCCSTKGKNAEPIYIQIKELEVINEKCKELRMDKLDTIFFTVIIGIMIGSLLTALNIAYTMNKKATKQETNNSVIYSYTWEVLKKDE